MHFFQKYLVELSGTVVGFVSSVFGMLNGAILTVDELHAMKVALLCGVAGGVGGLVVKAVVILFKKLIKFIKTFFSGRIERR